MLFFVAEQVPCSCSSFVPSCLPVVLVMKYRPIRLSVVLFPLVESTLVIFWRRIKQTWSHVFFSTKIMSHIIPSSDPSRFDEDLDPPVNNNKEDSLPNKHKGRKKGARGWVKKEIDALLDIIESILPCGSKQWDLVSLELLDYGFKQRDGKSCKHKFEMLWTKERPTGMSEIPLHITSAKDI